MEKTDGTKILTLDESSIFGGVCSGLSEHYGLNKNGLRVAFVICSLFFLLPTLVYIVMWLILPKYPSSQAMARHLRRLALQRRSNINLK